ncbi:MAG: hypothetical protein ACKVQS_13290 [Fimbriimonadaceae bacterium]
MDRFLPGTRIELQASQGAGLWFLPAECEVIESLRDLHGRVVRAKLSIPIPLRNTDIEEVVLLVGETGSCDVYMGLSGSLSLDPILQIGQARVV